MPPESPLILAFDTSAAHCAAALVRGSAVLASRNEPMHKGQAERLMPMLEEVMADAGCAWSELDLVAVGTGPGNFTGVRISVASARALSLALDIPAVGVSMFEAFASATEGRAAILLDGRRERVIWQVFQDGKAVSEPMQTEIESLGQDEFPEGTVLFGFAAEVLGTRLGLQQGLLGELQPQSLATVASRKQPEKRPAPLYLRAADAALPSDPPPMILDDA